MSKASTYQRRARDFAQRENWDAAVAELRLAIAADAANPMLHNQMGDLFLRKEEVQQACLHFEKAIDLYTELSLHANAVALCRKVIRLCPSRVEVRFRLARLRHEQGLQSETTASFVDYLEHLPAHNDGDVRTLEERCRDIVEQYPQAAPIGKILEKLETVRAFACAFELVQRLAQRAADAGDDEAARRYTTKMRSLRVLVEGQGGDLPGEPAARERPPAAVPGFGEVDLQAGDSSHRRPTTMPATHAAPPAAAPSLPIEDIRGTIGRTLFGADTREAPTPVPEIALDGLADPTFDVEPPMIEAGPDPTQTPGDIAKEYELPETSLADIATLFAASADTEPRGSAETAFELELPDASASARTDLPAETAFELELPDASASASTGLPAETAFELELPDAPAPAVVDMPAEPVLAAADPWSSDPEARADDEADAGSDPESMPPTMPEAARLWVRAETEATPLQAPEGSSSVVGDLSRPEPAVAREVAAPLEDTLPTGSIGAVRAPKSPESPEFEGPTPVQESDWPLAARQADSLGAATMPAGAAAPSSPPLSPPAVRELRAPVWVPDEHSGELFGLQPSNGGSTHELLEVIDTFRRQMALALGDDAAARYDLGVAYFEMGLYDEARAEFEVARRSAALRERSLEMLASCLGMQGRHAEILDLLQPALENQSDTSLGLGLRFSMGVACEALGRRSEARRHFEAVAQVDRSYRDVGDRLQRY